MLEAFPRRLLFVYDLWCKKYNFENPSKKITKKCTWWRRGLRPAPCSWRELLENMALVSLRLFPYLFWFIVLCARVERARGCCFLWDDVCAWVTVVRHIVSLCLLSRSRYYFPRHKTTGVLCDVIVFLVVHFFDCESIWSLCETLKWRVLLWACMKFLTESLQNLSVNMVVYFICTYSKVWYVSDSSLVLKRHGYVWLIIKLRIQSSFENC